MSDDSRLRDSFASLRRSEEARTPSFERVIGRAPGRFSRRFWGLTVASTVLLAAVTVLVFWVSNPRQPSTNHAAAPMLADWRAPTDFLLDTPGRELLHTIPEIGHYPPVLGHFLPTPSTTPAPRAGREHS